MKNSTFIAIIATTSIVLIGGVTVVYFKGAKELDQEQAIGPNKVQLALDPSFAPVKNANQPFEAVVTVTPARGSAITGKIQHNGKRVFRMEITQDGKLFESYETPEETIYCQKSGCYRTDPAQRKTLFDTDKLLYEETELGDLGRGLLKTGETACNQTVCEVWESSSVITDGAMTKVMLEKGSGKIAYIEGIEENNRYSISYSYKPVDVILPLQIEDLPDQDTSGN